MRQRFLLGLSGLLLVLIALFYRSSDVSATTIPFTPDAPDAPAQNISPPSPVQLTELYLEPELPGPRPRQLLSDHNVALRFDNIIYQSRKEDRIQAYKTAYAAANSGQSWPGRPLLYVLLNGMNGPASLYPEFTTDENNNTVNNYTRECRLEEQRFVPLGNNIMHRRSPQIEGNNQNKNEFCKLHDAIVRGAAEFDHDQNPNTPALRPIEEWFLHVPEATAASTTPGSVLIEAGEMTAQAIAITSCPGCRVVESHSDYNNSYQFRPNPLDPWPYDTNATVPPVHEMVAGRVKYLVREYPIFDGLFLDNVEFTENKLKENTGQTVPEEYADNDQDFDDFLGDVYELTRRVKEATKLQEPNHPIWGNLITAYTSETGWLQYDPLLDGAMQEFFALNESAPDDTGKGCQRSASEILQQINQAGQWLSRGNHYFASVLNNSEGSCGGSTFYQRSQFAFGLYLLITNGNASFHLSDRTSGEEAVYRHLEQYDMNFGSPVDPPAPTLKPVSMNPLIYRRRFQNCVVEVNVTEATTRFPCPNLLSRLFLPVALQNSEVRAAEPGAVPMPPSTPSLSGYPQPPSAYPAPATATPAATTTPYVVGRVYNPRGTPIMARMCRTDGYSTPTLCQTTSNPASFAVPPSGSQRGIWTVAGANEVVVGVTPLSAGGTSVLTSSTGQHVWPRWSTGSRTVRFVMATVTPSVTRTPTATRTPTRTPMPAPPTTTPRWSPTPVTCTDLGCAPTPTPGVSMQSNLETPVPIELVP
jgi:hypothetical protein